MLYNVHRLFAMEITTFVIVGGLASVYTATSLAETNIPITSSWAGLVRYFPQPYLHTLLYGKYFLTVLISGLRSGHGRPRKWDLHQHRRPFHCPSWSHTPGLSVEWVRWRYLDWDRQPDLTNSYSSSWGLYERHQEHWWQLECRISALVWIVPVRAPNVICNGCGGRQWDWSGDWGCKFYVWHDPPQQLKYEPHFHEILEGAFECGRQCRVDCWIFPGPSWTWLDWLRYSWVHQLWVISFPFLTVYIVSWRVLASGDDCEIVTTNWSQCAGTLGVSGATPRNPSRIWLRLPRTREWLQAQRFFLSMIRFKSRILENRTPETTNQKCPATSVLRSWQPSLHLAYRRIEILVVLGEYKHEFNIIHWIYCPVIYTLFNSSQSLN